MKKTALTVLALMVGFLLIAGNLYADGDLFVMGNLGVGTDAPSTELDIVGRGKLTLTSTTNNHMGWDVRVTQTADGNKIRGLRFITSTTATTPGGNQTITGFQGSAAANGIGGDMTNANALVGGRAATSVTMTNGVDVTIASAIGMQSIIAHGMHINDSDTTITNAYAFYSKTFNAEANFDATSSLTLNNLYGMYIENAGSVLQTSVINQTGLYIEGLNTGTNNYGIVLDGDGAGADIVFGEYSGLRPRIYSRKGRLYAHDSLDNRTILSPHDPVTGEWIFYSKNMKTGEVMRVDMERLVRTVEKLTGEKFMVKTIEEVK